MLRGSKEGHSQEIGLQRFPEKKWGAVREHCHCWRKDGRTVKGEVRKKNGRSRYLKYSRRQNVIDKKSEN